MRSHRFRPKYLLVSACFWLLQILALILIARPVFAEEASTTSSDMLEKIRSFERDLEINDPLADFKEAVKNMPKEGPACEVVPEASQRLQHIDWPASASAVTALSDTTEWRLDLVETAEQSILIFEGRIGVEGQYEAFSKAFELISSHQRPLLLVLNSPGGKVEEGGQIAALITHYRDQGRRLDTYVPDRAICASFCTNFFPLGQQRFAAPSAYFMFHSAHIGGWRRGDRAGSNIQFAGQTDKATEEVDAQTHKASPDINWTKMDLSRVGKAVNSGKDCWETGAGLFEAGYEYVNQVQEF